MGHALALLQDVSATGTWEGRATVMAADPTCGFRTGRSRCGLAIRHVVILLDKSLDKPCLSFVLCDEHAALMERAIKKWRATS